VCLSDSKGEFVREFSTSHRVARPPYPSTQPCGVRSACPAHPAGHLRHLPGRRVLTTGRSLPIASARGRLVSSPSSRRSHADSVYVGLFKGSARAPVTPPSATDGHDRLKFGDDRGAVDNRRLGRRRREVIRHQPPPAVALVQGHQVATAHLHHMVTGFESRSRSRRQPRHCDLRLASG